MSLLCNAGILEKVLSETSVGITFFELSWMHTLYTFCMKKYVCSRHLKVDDESITIRISIYRIPPSPHHLHEHVLCKAVVGYDCVAWISDSQLHPPHPLVLYFLFYYYSQIWFRFFYLFSAAKYIQGPSKIDFRCRNELLLIN